MLTVKVVLTGIFNTKHDTYSWLHTVKVELTGIFHTKQNTY